MGSNQAHLPLVVRDDNVEATAVVVYEPTKVKRNTWNEAQLIALVNQTYLDEFCPIGKRSHAEINATWSKLLAALSEHPDGIFHNFNLSQRSIQRQLTALMEKQDKRNAEALAATGRGGCAVHTDLEQGVQRLIDLRDGLKQKRAVEKEEKNTRSARLDEDAKRALKRSMETHAKKARRPSSERLSGASLRAGAVAATITAKIDTANQLINVAMEENVEATAVITWMKADKFYRLHPDVAEDPGPKEAWIASAVEAHRRKVREAAAGNTPSSEEDETGNGVVQLDHKV
eukprot:scaffold166_cov340-Pavlova_lutheri.AAC.5